MKWSDELIRERDELKAQLAEARREMAKHIAYRDELLEAAERVLASPCLATLNRLRAVMKKGTYGAALSSKARSPKREGRGAKKHGPYCRHTVVIDGSEVGCALAYGHSGEHDHIRGLGVSTKRVDAQATLSSTLRNE